MSEKKNGQLNPPNYLPLVNSHNTALDMIVADSGLGRTNISASEEDILNGNTSENVDLSLAELLGQDVEFTKEPSNMLKQNLGNTAQTFDVSQNYELDDVNEKFLFSSKSDYNLNKKKIGNNSADGFDLESFDKSLSDLQGAAFRYASLNRIDLDTIPQGSDENVFSVHSLGWLPMSTCSSDPDVSSADVNACIRHLSQSHGQIMDGIGAWGEGKRLKLVIDQACLKLTDPITDVVLQKQSIKQIRVWGVGRDSQHDFAYVVKDPDQHSFKCHVFRCDVAARAIAQQLHLACEKISEKRKLEKSSNEKERVAMMTKIPERKSEPKREFKVQYLGFRKNVGITGMSVIKDVIIKVTCDDQILCHDALLSVTPSAILITRVCDGSVIVNCRTRYLSFMGIGSDISLFAFISVAGETNCHVVQCLPNAAKLAFAVQEACVLRYQMAVDSNSVMLPVEKKQSPRTEKRSFGTVVKNILFGSK